MSSTRKRKISQTAAAKKARSEAGKRGAATRKANREASIEAEARAANAVDSIEALNEMIARRERDEPVEGVLDTPYTADDLAKLELRVLKLSEDNARLRKELERHEPVEALFEGVHDAGKRHPTLDQVAGRNRWPETEQQEAAGRAVTQVARVVRNLRSAVVHLTLQAPDRDKGFRLNLRPRGERGDAQAVPYGFQHDPQFQGSIGILFEVITQTEARQLAYGPAGYSAQHRDTVQVIRDADTVKTVGRINVGGERGTTVTMDRAAGQPLPGALEAPQEPSQAPEGWSHEKQQEWAAQQRQASVEKRAEKKQDRPHGANIEYANVPGSDTGLQTSLNAASAAGIADQQELRDEEVGPAKVERQLSEEQARMIALVEQGERAERAKISKLERDGIMPEGALKAKVTIVRAGG